MRHPRLLIVPLAALVLSACIMVPSSRQGAYYEPMGAESAVPPPAPYVEVVPVMPFVGALWIGGYWGWSGPAPVGAGPLGAAAARVRMAAACLGPARRPVA
jgi:hypothetical protein